jgi:hypothetical protein
MLLAEVTGDLATSAPGGRAYHSLIVAVNAIRARLVFVCGQLRQLAGFATLRPMARM